jgi:hypothetical protein
VRFISGIPEKKPQPVSDGSGNVDVQAQGDIRLLETEVRLNLSSLFHEVEDYSCSVLTVNFGSQNLP